MSNTYFAPMRKTQNRVSNNLSDVLCPALLWVLTVVLMVLSSNLPAQNLASQPLTNQVQPNTDKSSNFECLFKDDINYHIDTPTVKTLRNQVTRAQKIQIGDKRRIKRCELLVSNLVSDAWPFKPILIDTRKPKEFKRGHIPGSINLPGNKIITHRQWQRKEIVLIDKGHSYNANDQLCLDLTEAGFKKVYVLEGGIRSWQAQGYSLVGRDPGSQDVAEMSAQEFYSESNYDHWLLLMSDEKNPGEIGNLGQHLVTINPADKNAVILLAKKFQKLQNSIDTNPHILVIEEDIHLRNSLLKVAQQISSLSFFLDGGVKAYQSHLLRQHIIWNYEPGLNRGVLCGQ